ncbi:hypothetical protein [Streptomyces sp. NPDC001843]|uniref:hypothetical protein n=1 Tax=Streptomyces sp. NPDC001843 TaxID=3364617 RepID=UPI00369287E9
MRIRRLGPLTRFLLLAVTVAALAAAVWGAVVVLTPDPSCGPGVRKRDGERTCTGVTDGSVSFGPQLDEVFARIKAENDSIGSTPHVTIALMVPMDLPTEAGRLELLREVQGAYFSQYRANHESNSQTPAIRLELANPGRNSAHWRPVADQLAAMAASPQDNLRVVFGFDISVRSTQKTIDYLTNKKKIPVVGGPITADDIANTEQNPAAFNGLVRVNPSNSDQINALTHFDHGVPAHQTLVVEDLRDDDNYIVTLRKFFEARTRGAPLAPEQFRSPADVDSPGGTSNDFRQMISTICDSSAKDIYFAGRPVQLRQFLNELGHRGCSTRDFTVISGPAANALAWDSQFDWNTLRHGVTLEFSATAHPDAWTGPDVPATGGSPAAYHILSDLAKRGTHAPIGPVGPVDLTDSRTIISYDSAWTAITAIRERAVRGTALPSTDDIRNVWLRLHGPNRIDGASGWICLDNHGNPYDKAVSVVRLDPVTRSIRFVALSWPTGHPPTAECTAPPGG